MWLCLFQGRSKAEKKRQKAEELFLKASHSQRQEAAQLRREEKARADKERLMNEEDPDKARKLEVSQFLHFCMGQDFVEKFYLHYTLSVSVCVSLFLAICLDYLSVLVCINSCVDKKEKYMSLNFSSKMNSENPVNKRY